MRLGQERTLAGSVAFTLTEVVMATALVAVVFGGILISYQYANYESKWTGYSLAAQALAVQSMEQAKSAIWDPAETPAKNEVANMATIMTNTFDLPVSGSNVIWATNFLTISIITNSVNPMVTVQAVRVQTVWPFGKGKVATTFTNTMYHYFAPSNPLPD